jgi:hypothetical protein
MAASNSGRFPARRASVVGSGDVSVCICLVSLTGTAARRSGPAPAPGRR